MKNRFKLFLLGYFLLNLILLRAQGWDWANKLGIMSYNQIPQKLYIGKANDFYITYAVSDSIMSSGPNCESGTHQFTNYLRRYNIDGTLKWSIPCAQNIFYHSAVIANNDIVSIGPYSPNCILPTSTITAPGSYLLTRTSSSGTIKALRTFSNKNLIANILSDDLGRYYLWGLLQDTLTIGNTTLYNVGGGYNQRFLLAFSSNDSLLYAKKFDNCYQSRFQIDKLGNVLISGNYNDTLRYEDSLLFTSDNSSKGFLFKIDSNFKLLWWKSTPRLNITPRLEFDNSSNIYLSGMFYDSLTFNGTTYFDTTSNSNNRGDALIVKFNPNGNVIYATRVYNPKQGDGIFYHTVSPQGEVLFACHISDTMRVNSTLVISPNPTYPYSYTCFLGRLDYFGNLNWHKFPSTPVPWYPTSLITDNYGNLYLSASNNTSFKLGNYQDSTACFVNGAPNHKFFTTRYLFNPPSGIYSQNSSTSYLSFYPNPARNTIYFKKNSNDKAHFIIYDCTGKSVFKGLVLPEVNLPPLSIGLYIIEVNTNQYLYREKLIIE